MDLTILNNDLLINDGDFVVVDPNTATANNVYRLLNTAPSVYEVNYITNNSIDALDSNYKSDILTYLSTPSSELSQIARFIIEDNLKVINDINIEKIEVLSNRQDKIYINVHYQISNYLSKEVTIGGN